ncbi:MAG: orotate phosphoribosyltransferase [Spirochaetia bacterium]|nr:orotate phosphoribosyltransferase [Spirochaetia bacterium]
MRGVLAQELYGLVRSLAYRYDEKPFLLASGRTSHHYFNCKVITLHPERLQLLSHVLRDELLPSSGIADFEAVGGLTLGADPIAYGLCLAFLDKHRVVYPLIVRKEAKDHGTGRRIEGETTGVKRVVVLDDVVTTAGSTLKAVSALREAGLIVEHAVAILDREEGGREALQKEGIALHSVFKKSDFLEPGQSSE